MKIVHNQIVKDLSQEAFIIAEMSANHKHDFKLAKKTIKAAFDSGADAIKLQTYTPDTITIDCDNEYFQIKHGSIWDGTTLFRLYEEAYTPWEWQPELMQYANSLGILLFSSPFDLTAVDFLEAMDVPAYKIASFEITDIPLIEYVASKNKPILISTGIATEQDIQEAVDACKRVGNPNIILLKCTSAYPSPLDEMNLRNIPLLSDKYRTMVGLSDHSMGTTAAVAAVALGARVIEKHFILDREMGGPDALFSMEPDEFRAMVEEIRKVETALGNYSYRLTESMLKSKQGQRSLFVVKDVKQGERITEKNIRSIRPGHGLPPKYLPKVLNKCFTRDILNGTPLGWHLIK